MNGKISVKMHIHFLFILRENMIENIIVRYIDLESDKLILSYI